MSNGLAVDAAKKFFREVKSPSAAAEFFWRLVVPVDPRLRKTRSWIWGKLPRLELKQVFPGIEKTSILMLDAYNRNSRGLETEELAALLSMAKFLETKKIFEIGTCDGGTALNLAANTSPETQVFTLDLGPNWNGEFSIKTPAGFQYPTDASLIGQRFHGTPYEKKITQVFGDSAKFDWSTLPGPFDMVFIDGCHFYEYVVRDTENAMKNLRPGGLVVWHDYGYVKGVSDVVDDLSSRMKVAAIAGTRLAVGFMPYVQ
ncbi:MAG TPA: class I SAM-dependent methyltransferase [Terriglobales bacterium]|nr:class I SAM-dependent methyltransferase [Terriglobales bacterium]